MVPKSGAFTFNFLFFLYLNLEIKYRKRDPFSLFYFLSSQFHPNHTNPCWDALKANSVWFQKVVYSLFIFSFLYLNSEIEYRKNDSFSHLRVLVVLNTLFGYKIHHNRVWNCFLFQKKKGYFFHLHTFTSSWTPLCFYHIYKIVTVFIFYENENVEKIFSFFVSKFNF